MEYVLNFVDSVTRILSIAFDLCLAAIVPLGIAAFINWLMRDAVVKQVRSQEGRWEADRKESAYLECLKLLWQSRCQYHKESKLNHGDFMGRMQTLQYVEPWMVVAGNRSSTESRSALGSAMENLKKTIDLVKKENPKDSGDTDPTNGNRKIFTVEGHKLPEEIDKTLDIVIECCKKELSHNSMSCPF
ncbi:MAG: hypothetical protein ACOYXY_16795, partial [Thermodesulfobacteriota bacterium]